MPSASERAKAKYQAVLDDPMRHFKNREAVTRTPSGGSDIANSITRRPSSSSQTGPHKHPLRNMIRSWMSRPAF